MIPREVESLFEKLQPILGRKLDPLRVEYQLNPAARPEIELLLSQLLLKHLGGNCPLIVPDKDAVSGDYTLGRVIAGDQIWTLFGLNEGEWIQHVGIFGRSGSGKTNVGFLILKEFCSHQKPFLVFDWKRNYRDLLRQPEFADLKIFTVGRDISSFCFNPLLPPSGTEPEIFLKKLIEIMMHVYWLGDGVAYLLQKAIDAVYQEQGVYSKQCEEFPTLFDVRDWLRSYKARGREAQWMDSTRRVIETLCFGQVGKVLKTRSNAEFDKLLASQVILELDTLSNSDKTFLIEAILLWLHHKRMCQAEREIFKHAIVIEEAHHVLLKRKESKETIVDVILREIRELGEAIIFLDQHPSLVSIPSLGNSYCTVAMNLKHGNDVSALARAMLLTDDEKDFLGKLPVGESIVKLQGRWVKPFHVQFPHFRIEKGTVSDSDLSRQDLGDSPQNENISASQGQEKEILVIPAGDRDSNQEGITSVESRFLEEVMGFPIAGINERKERLGISIRQLYSVISSLLSKGLVSSSSVSTLKGRKRITRLTAAGMRALGKENSVPVGKNESPEHWYWKVWAAEELRKKAYFVEIERDGTDVFASKDGKEIAVEIETGKSDIEANIRRDVEHGFNQVILVYLYGRPPASKGEAARVLSLAEFQEHLDSLPNLPP